MDLPRESVLLRIFVGESDRFEHRPLYEAIVLKAREAHLAGATVLRGPMGFGRSSRLHTAKIVRLSEDLPMVIEIVDREEKVRAFLPELERMVDSCLVTLERVEVVRYGAPGNPGSEAPAGGRRPPASPGPA
jgi:PII-like signaling protein